MTDALTAALPAVASRERRGKGGAPSRKPWGKRLVKYGLGSVFLVGGIAGAVRLQRARSARTLGMRAPARSARGSPWRVICFGSGELVPRNQPCLSSTITAITIPSP